MIKITFLGAGSTVFAKNVLGDCLCTKEIAPHLEIALYDIDSERLEDSENLIQSLNKTYNQSQAVIKSYCGPEQRKEALRGADFIINAVQIGGYEPSTVIDFEIPKKYGLRQTIADTVGIGGIFRALRTIPFLRECAEEIEQVCPNAWFINYTNPMAMLSNFMQRYTNVKTVGLCHSVQNCSKNLLKALDIESEGTYDLIAGINHMGWLLDIRDKNGKDLYPLIRERAAAKNASEKHKDMVRYEYIRRLGYYCTESSEHNAEYNPFFIKQRYPELIENYNIPLDEYPRRCIKQIEDWAKQREELFNGGNITHERTEEYASYIIHAMFTNIPFRLGGNVLNKGLITNLPSIATVEVPCMVDSQGVTPTYVGDLPLQLAAMNSSNIYPQLLTVEAAVTGNRETLYQAAMMEPHTAAELSVDDIVAMCDEMIEAHNKTGFLNF